MFSFPELTYVMPRYVIFSCSWHGKVLGRWPMILPHLLEPEQMKAGSQTLVKCWDCWFAFIFPSKSIQRIQRPLSWMGTCGIGSTSASGDTTIATTLAKGAWGDAPHWKPLTTWNVKAKKSDVSNDGDTLFMTLGFPHYWGLNNQLGLKHVKQNNKNLDRARKHGIGKATKHNIIYKAFINHQTHLIRSNNYYHLLTIYVNVTYTGNVWAVSIQGKKINPECWFTPSHWSIKLSLCVDAHGYIPH